MTNMSPIFSFIFFMFSLVKVSAPQYTKGCMALLPLVPLLLLR